MVHGSSLLEMFISIISETSRVVKGSGEGKLSSKKMIFSKSKSPQVTIDWHNPTTPNLNLYHNCHFPSINPNSIRCRYARKCTWHTSEGYQQEI